MQQYAGNRTGFSVERCVVWLNEQISTEYLVSAEEYRNKIVHSLAHTAPAHRKIPLPVVSMLSLHFPLTTQELCKKEYESTLLLDGDEYVDPGA